MIRVTSEVNIYEIDGKEVDWQTNSMDVLSHWNCPGQVILKIGGYSYTVIATELEAAIKNAINSVRF